MKISTHFYSSALLGGGAYAATQSSQLALSCFLSGLLIDIDHLFDFLLFSKDKFSLKNAVSWCEEARWNKITLIFHSYEVYFSLCLLALYISHPVLMGILMGTGLHLLMDQVGNCNSNSKYKLSKLFYFLTFRAYVGFRKEKLTISKQNVMVPGS